MIVLVLMNMEHIQRTLMLAQHIEGTLPHSHIHVLLRAIPSLSPRRPALNMQQYMDKNSRNKRQTETDTKPEWLNSSCYFRIHTYKREREKEDKV